MPTPLEILIAPGSLTILSLYGGLMLWEGLTPGRALPRVRGWRFKGLLYFAVFFFASAYLPMLWDAHLASYQLLDLRPLGTVGGTAAGLFVYEIGAWVYHRALHRFAPLWRIHQTHHSAERLDTYGAFVFHPVDTIGWTLLGSLSLVLVVGVSAEAAGYIVLIVNWLGMFQHANIKTPRWLGYFVQRPESHTVHHARNVHRMNYADLPVIDMLFGTFENPAGFEHETGLHPGASTRNLDLLLLRDVSNPVRSASGPSSVLTRA